MTILFTLGLPSFGAFPDRKAAGSGPVSDPVPASAGTGTPSVLTSAGFTPAAVPNGNAHSLPETTNSDSR